MNKTNFQFLIDIRENENSQLIESNRFTHNILISMIMDLEKKFFDRDYDNKNVEFRYINELLTKYLYNEILDLSNPNNIGYSEVYEDVFEDWKIRDEQYGSTKWGLKNLCYALRSADLICDEEKKLWIDFNKDSHRSAHLVDFENIDNEIEGKFINGEFKLKQTTYYEYLEKLKTLHKILGVMISLIYEFKINNFDEKIYEDGRNSISEALKDDEFATLVKADCGLCEEGILELPEGKYFMHGAFLKCNNCSAKLSKNLFLKEENKDTDDCVWEGCIGGKIKRTASYKKEDALPGKVYGEIKSICNLCKKEPEQILND